MTLRAINGGCLIRPDTVTDSGGIAIPAYIQRVGRPSGILLQADTDDPEILSCLGLRVVIRTAIAFKYMGEFYLMGKVDQLLAVVPKGGDVKILDDIERCQWCKSAGEGNMLLDHAGYCIQCHRNKYGQLQEGTITHPKASRPTEDEVYRFGGTAEFQMNKENAKGKVISYPGQSKRTAAEQGKPKLYVPPARKPISQVGAIPKSEGKIISAASLKKRSPL